MAHIRSDFPGGNIRVEANGDTEILLSKEMRGSSGIWFYWYFEAEFDQPGTYTFRFSDGASIGTQGPATCTPDGKNWRWLGADSIRNTQDSEAFLYSCQHPETRRFCVGMQYLQSDWEEFLGRENLSGSVLCRSRQGRDCEMLELGSGEIPVVITSRHHCCEMAATYVLEGILASALKNPACIEKFCFLAIPFVDKDGVENGDQGKNRLPHDHARDYNPTPIYPECAAIQQLILARHPLLVMDLHCPWLRSGASNESIYLVGSSNPDNAVRAERFAVQLEKHAVSDAPYYTADNIPFGTSWNTAANYTQGSTLVTWSSRLPWQPTAVSFEIPYANTREVALTPSAWRHLGQNFLESMDAFFENMDC